METSYKSQTLVLGDSPAGLDPHKFETPDVTIKNQAVIAAQQLFAQGTVENENTLLISAQIPETNMNNKEMISTLSTLQNNPNTSEFGQIINRLHTNYKAVRPETAKTGAGRFFGFKQKRRIWCILPAKRIYLCSKK